MDYSRLLDNHSIDYEALKNWGFHEEGGYWVFVKDSSEPSFCFEIALSPTTLKVELIDRLTHEAYVPFSLAGVHGGFVAGLREESDALIASLTREVFHSESRREELLAYASTHFDVLTESPWKDYPNFVTLKARSSKKWFGLVMEVPYAKLGLAQAGMADVLNLKADPQEIQHVIDHRFFFPAYHMNKTYWLTILLSVQAPWAKIEALLNKSYSLVEKPMVKRK